ncbi:MAG: T9SS type A sorting domain-containing protein [Ignavibacteriae bacterium]|nr:T9SS type A sorting domain-containing protein [Ignavibacteriota bacterium]
MKKTAIKYFFFATMLLSASLLFPSSLSVQAKKSIMLQFITYNGYGNNLYLDNIITGNRANFDLAITSINNIPRDTSFLPGTSSTPIFPSVNVTNIGLVPTSDSVKVTIRIPELSYSDEMKIGPMNKGQTSEAVFSMVSIQVNQPITVITYLSYASDSLNSNDTLKQTSLFLTGAPKNMLLEQFTSATSPSCGYNDIFLDTFVNNHIGNICAIKYHVGFPPPGIDSFYIRDTAMIEHRREYYFDNSVPLSIVDGRSRISLPYYVDSNLTAPYYVSTDAGSPVSVTVTNQYVDPDTIQSTVVVQFLYPVQSNKLFLRVAAVEREVDYANPIGASGEMTFYDVCRKMLTDSIGFPVSGTGTSQFVVKYYVDPSWQDTSIYTVAFIQDDLDRTILNSGKSLNTTPHRKSHLTIKKPDIIKPDFDTKKFYRHRSFARGFSPAIADTVSYFNYELFEGPFLPKGWRIYNIDGFFTFEKCTGVNGVTIAGNNSMKMPFYDYLNIGQRDTLYTVSFDSVSWYDTLTFDWAYAVYLSEYNDSLAVNISVDGGNTFANFFNKGGYELATALSTTLPFIPYSTTQWKTFRFPLSAVIPPDNRQNIVPNNYELGQNYPNPFNPRTTIGYKIPKDGFVSIKVYDITGREIAKIVNEYKKAGTYESVFTADRLASGVYFYVLQAGDFVQAKKLVLLK